MALPSSSLRTADAAKSFTEHAAPTTGGVMDMPARCYASFSEAPSVPVHVHIEVLRPNITVMEEQFEAAVAITLILTWTDQRLMGHAGAIPDNLWHPSFVLALKAGGPMHIISTTLKDAEAGVVVQMVRLPKDGRIDLREVLHLSRFPLEVISALICISPACGKGVVNLIFRKHTVNEESLQKGIKDSGFVWHNATYPRDSEWDHTGIMVEPVEAVSPFSGVVYSKVAIIVTMRRNPGFYAIKGLLPLSCAILMGLSANIIDPLLDEAFSNRVQIYVAVLLTVIAIQWTVAAKLPKTPDLTIFDRVILSCLGFTLLQTAEAASVEIMKRADFLAHTIRTIDFIAVMVFLATYALGVLILCMFWWRQTSDDSSLRAMKESLAHHFGDNCTITEPLAFVPVRSSQLQLGKEVFLWRSDLPSAVRCQVLGGAAAGSSDRDSCSSNGTARARHTKVTGL